MISIIRRNWRGENSLFLTFFGFLILFPTVVGYTIRGINPEVTYILISFDLLTGDGLRQNALINLYSIYSAIFISYVWAIVGVWRCTKRYLNETNKRLFPILARVIVFIFSPFILLFLLSLITNAYTKNAEDYHKEPKSYELSLTGDILSISGEFYYGLPYDLHRFIMDNPEIKVISLRSTGGTTFIGRDMAKIIEKYGLDTYVSDYCHSACTDAFLGGNNRIITQTAKMGFHRSGNIRDPGEEITKSTYLAKIFGDSQWSASRRFFSNYGMNSEFIEEILAVPFEDAWYPPNERLLKENYVTKILPSPILE